MTTVDFNTFLIAQEKRDRATDKAIAELREDLALIHRSRHETQENLSTAIGEIHLGCAATDKNLRELTELVKELVQAMRGNSFGSSGVVAQIADHEKRIGGIETSQKELRGMSRLIGWGASAIGVLIAWKELQK